MTGPSPTRYRRQIAYENVGLLGQERIAQARIAVCGVGALGAMVAERLGRCGIGMLRLIDRDWVELDNLPRQALFTHQDAMARAPKAIAAQSHLLDINPDIQIESHVVDLDCRNAQALLRDVDCIVDGTDNFETRYLINDLAIQQGIPWVHAGIVGASGQSMTIRPNQTACFRCLMPEPPPVEAMQSCDSAGVLGPAVGLIASWQAMEAIKVVLGKAPNEVAELTTFDLWNGVIRSIRIQRDLPRPEQTNRAPHHGCKACVQRQFEFLDGDISTHAKVLCGRNAVQIHPLGREPIDLSRVAARLRPHGEVLETPYFVRFSVEEHTLSLFADGRGIVQGTENEDEARKIYGRWIGG